MEPRHGATSARQPLTYLRAWADLLDSRFVIPGTRIRFGLDPILALIPGLGDLASPVFAVAILAQAVLQGVPRVIMVRIVANAFIDACIGAIPFLGPVGDIFWRANTRNLALLERHARPGVRPTRGDYVFVAGVAMVFGTILLVPVLVALWLALWVLGR